jgi:hypothetical protein
LPTVYRTCWEESIPSSTTNLGEGKLDTPHLTLVAEAVFADDLQFGIAVIAVRKP